MASTNPSSAHPSPPHSDADRHSPPARNSMEDGNSNVTRKRPRLDSGERAHQNLISPYFAKTTSQHLSKTTTAHDNPDAMSTSQHSSRYEHTDDKSGAASKMTLNIRDASQARPQASAQAADEVSADSSAHGAGAQALPQISSNELVQSQQDEASPPDHDSEDAIHIEIAEPEDVDAPADQTVWSDASARKLRDWQRKHINHFPQLVGGRTWEHEMRDLPERILEQPGLLPVAMEEITTWINAYLHKTQGDASSWPDLIDHNYQFWQAVPYLMGFLIGDDLFSTEQLLNDLDSATTHLNGFIAAYISLTTRMVAVDRELLGKSTTERSAEAPLYCFNYLQTLRKTLMPRVDGAGWAALERLGVDLSLRLDELACTGQDEGTLFHELLKLAPRLLSRTALDTSLQRLLKVVVSMPPDLFQHYQRYYQARSQTTSERSGESLLHSFQSLEATLRNAIKKQLPILSGDLFIHFFELPLRMYINHSVTVASEILTRFGLATRTMVSALSEVDRRDLAETIWSIDLYEKGVREGRMEIRMTGLDNLQNGLIKIYQRYIADRVASDPIHPTVDAVSDQLLQNRIVEYLLSVDSHPQIISRSANVVGFLAVSGRWTNAQTDSIWQTVEQMEDPRACETILDMLPDVTKYLNSDDLVHVIQCMQETVTSKIDRKVLNLLLHVCTQLVEKTTDHGRALTVVVTAYATVLRKASAHPALYLPRKFEIWNMIQKGFQDLAVIDWPLPARLAIYRDCFQDLEVGSLQTSGSCAIIRRLLERYLSHDLTQVVNDFNAVALVISDFARLAELSSATRTNFDHFMTPVEDRLRILECIIAELPESIPSEAAAHLWNNLLAEKAVCARAREAAWEMLARVAHDSKSPNCFLDECIQNHLPSLSSKYFSRSTLNFAQHVCGYENRTTSDPNHEKSTLALSPTSDHLFWQLALTAEDDLVSAKASQTLVGQARNQSKSDPESRRELFLVDKCINQAVDFGTELTQLSSEQAEPRDVTLLERGFKRVFSMLSNFLTAMQDDSPGSPSNRSDSQISQSSIQGERIQIKYMTSNRGVSSPTKTIDIGSEQTFGELTERLRARTGFTRFNVIVGGERLDVERQSIDSIFSLGLHQKGVMILHRIPGTEVLKSNPSRATTRPVDNVVLRHFDKLYALLDCSTPVADQILQLLQLASPHPSILRLVSDPDSRQYQVLPLATPHKASYSLHAITFKHRTHLEEGTIDHGFMRRCVHLMVDAVSELALPISSSKTRNPCWLPSELLQTLLSFLKEPVASEHSAAYFHQPAEFMDKLQEIANPQPSALGPDTFALSQICFAVMLETSRLNALAWKAFHESQSSTSLVERLLVLNPNHRDRLATCQAIAGVLASLPTPEGSFEASEKELAPATLSTSSLQAPAFVQVFWQMFCSILPGAVKTHPASCHQLFSMSMTIFNAFSDQSLDLIHLQGCVRFWTQLLLQHKPHYVVNGDINEVVVKGLCDLINVGMLVLHRNDLPPNLGSDFRQHVFDNLLFPPPHKDLDQQSPSENSPVLGINGRSALYRVILRSMVSPNNFKDLFELLNKVLEDPCATLPSLSFDRSKYMRAMTGYPGLDNLSNTCYLNSLMTQLFMNLKFREFILKCEIVDPDSQALLSSMQQLFASLQDGWQRSVDTKPLANSIETYDGPLDPTLQMDADEAFNLLFDRLESQLPTPREKAAFKNLYGGEIIQQIKSKECEHISERFEAFTAIQCDIQGKRNLLQSLEAYIEGENMEGDNKYKCSNCDRYVNAVKRACLKKVPDNLIFHLKRFDYDLMTGTRNKLNDHFMFPEMLDMAPYTIERLDGGADDVQADPFCLVGVLVHNGSAELGHYYSYIRERSGNLSSWVEFNDADVTTFDFSSLADQCFGGPTENSYNQTFCKTWNAYMLYYQRKSSIEADHGPFGQQVEIGPTKVEVRNELAAQVVSENESLAKIYCLSGPEHANFIKEVFSTFAKQRKGECSVDHKPEDEAIRCAWSHIELVFGKEHKRYGASVAIEFLSAMQSSCPKCCNFTVLWLTNGDGNSRMRLLLLRLPDPEIRTKLGNLLMQALQHLRVYSPALYGELDETYEVEDVDMDTEVTAARDEGAFALTLKTLFSLLEVAPLNFRSWPEFYVLLCRLAKLGPDEKAYMHRLGFLQDSLEVLLIEPRHDWEQRFQGKHASYIKLVGKRAYNLSSLLTFITTLLDGLKCEDDFDPMESEIGSFQPILTQEEKALLVTRLFPDGGDKRVPWALDRAATVNEFKSDHSTLEAITRFYMSNNESLQMENSIVDLIGNGIVKSPAEMATPYLHISLSFIALSSSPSMIQTILVAIADGTRTIGDSGGEEHLEFFRRALYIRNEHAFPDQPHQIALKVIGQAHMWGTSLLDYPDTDVPTRCGELLEKMLIQVPQHNEHDDELAEAVTTACERLWSEALERVQRYVRNSRILEDSKRGWIVLCESLLPKQFPDPENLSGEDEIAAERYKQLFAQAYELIAPPDDAGSNTFESDELTDVSSTYGSPGIEEIS